MVKAGECLRVQTKTLEDVFGVCFYEVIETGLKAPEPGREKEMDGVKVMMLGGTGPSARAGIALIDSQKKIAEDIATGITEVMSKEQAQTLLSAAPKQSPGGVPGEQARPATGVLEMD